MTTTLGAIINQMETTINALTPETFPAVLFRRAPRDKQLETWAVEHNSSSEVSRKYQIRRVKESQDPPFMHPEQVDRSDEVEIVVSYYVKEFHQSQDVDDTEDAIRSDANKIWGALEAPSILISDHNANFVEIGELDRSDEKVWFQKFHVIVRYYEARSPNQ
jgi:hypothetical protein